MWNNEQLKAIDYRNSSMVLSASAGSGKTAVLAERILRILLDEKSKTKADSLIITTFTNDAATEISQRLENSLSDYIANNPENTWALQQKILLKNAKISTMHKVFYDFLREYGYKINIQSNFRIANKSEIDNIIKTAIDMSMSEFCEENYNDYIFLIDKLCKKNDKKIELILLNILNFSYNIPFFKNYYKKFLIDNNYFIEEIRKLIYHKLIIIKTLILKAKDKAMALETNPEKNPLKVILSDLEIVNNSEKNFIYEKKFENLTKADDELKELRKGYKEKYVSLKQYFNVLLDFQNNFEIAKKITSILFTMLFKIEEKIFEAKIDKNILYHDDADRLILELLSEIGESGEIKKSQLCESISNSISYIMIDEFQDINDYQFLIFNLLAKDNNFFAVGDMKQAIYRFRGSNPDIFRELQGENNYKNFFLNQNYRSSKTVIDFVNDIFKTIKCDYFTGFIYTENDWLNVGRKENFSEYKNEFLLYDLENSEIEIVARKINNMLNSKTKIYSKSGEIRDCKPSDFCILARSRTKFNAYVSKLSEYGISVVCDIKKPFLCSREISSLIDFLKIIDNPLLDREMFSVLFSPVFSFSLDEIIEIKSDEKIYFQLLNNIDNPKINNFLEILSSLRNTAANSSLVELVLSIYDLSHFSEVFDYIDGYNSAKSNFNLFLDTAKKYEKDNFGGLHDFLGYIDRVIELSGDIKTSSPIAAGNCITITTIHGSKGLEYPFVFLVGTDTNFRFSSRMESFGKNNFANNANDFNFSKKFGFGFKILNKSNYTQFPTAQFLLIENENMLETRNEELRLMYVALTRARQQLFITVDMDLFLKKPPYREDAKSMADWLIYYLKFGNQTDYTIVYPTDLPVFEKINQINTITEDIDNNLNNKILENLSYKYPYNVRNSPIRVTVTEVKRELEFETPNLFSSEIILNQPKFLLGKKENLGVQGGNALHKFLEFADLSNNLKDEIENLQNNDILIYEEIKLLNLNKIQTFLSSNLIERLKKSKKINREREFFVDIKNLNSDIIPENYKNSYMMGKVDMYFEEEDGIVLVDYKTDYCQNPEQLKEKYKNQLLLYKSAIEVIENKKVKEVLIYSFHLGIEISL